MELGSSRVPSVEGSPASKASAVQTGIRSYPSNRLVVPFLGRDRLPEDPGVLYEGHSSSITDVSMQIQRWKAIDTHVSLLFGDPKQLAGQWLAIRRSSATIPLRRVV